MGVVSLGARARGAVSVAVVVPVLAVALAACGGGDGGAGGGNAARHAHGAGDGKDSSGGARGSGRGRGSGSGQPTPTRARLASALLRDGDVPGYRAQRTRSQDALAAPHTLDTRGARCAPVADALGAGPDAGRGRTARAGGAVIKKGGLGAGGAVQQVTLTAYRAGGAARELGRLKSALKSCRSLRSEVGGKTAKNLKGAKGVKTVTVRIDPGRAPHVGDDAARFTLRSGQKGSAPVVVTVIRTGNSTATYLSIGLAGKAVPVPDAVARKQDQKLAALAER
jgi:hypothetical protein